MKFYHISKTYLGADVHLTPRVPESCCTSTEGDIPRICVSPCIARCVRAILGTKKIILSEFLDAFKTDIRAFEHNAEFIARGGEVLSPAVYSTTKIPYLPPKCSDFRSNKEHWFLQDTLFVLEGYLSLQGILESSKFVLVETEERMKYLDLSVERFSDVVNI